MDNSSIKESIKHLCHQSNYDGIISFLLNGENHRFLVMDINIKLIIQQLIIDLSIKNSHNEEEIIFLRKIIGIHRDTSIPFKISSDIYKNSLLILIAYYISVNDFDEICYYIFEFPESEEFKDYQLLFENKLPRKIEFETNDNYSLNILLIEDNREHRNKIRDYLIDNYKKFKIKSITLAFDGLDGLKQFEILKHDLIISDNIMPRLSGLELLQKIKLAYPNLFYKTIIVTAFIETSYLIQAIELNTDCFIDKSNLFKGLESTLIKTSNDIITKKRHDKYELELLNKNKTIIDSINYASRIQKAILPDISSLNHIISDNFILFKPKDIVSGDFYWYHVKNGLLLLAAGDCTGHGVPGAMLSMLSISLLNEICINKAITTPYCVLNELRISLLKALNIKIDDSDVKDGMDLAFISIDLKSNLLSYSGAFNPIYIVRNSQITVFEGDRMPIGIHANLVNEFTNKEFQLQKDDIIYLFSDGYCDQFSSTSNTKFLSKRLKELILNISKKPMHTQKAILEEKHNEWRGSENQIDDILLIGIKI